MQDSIGGYFQNHRWLEKPHVEEALAIVGGQGVASEQVCSFFEEPFFLVDFGPDVEGDYASLEQLSFLVDAHGPYL